MKRKGLIKLIGFYTQVFCMNYIFGYAYGTMYNQKKVNGLNKKLIFNVLTWFIGFISLGILVQDKAISMASEIYKLEDSQNKNSENK